MPSNSIFNLSDLNGNNGFVITGLNPGDRLGFSISSGDINGDGIKDLLLGAPFAPSGSARGQSFVIFGSHSPFPATFDLSSLNSTNGFVTAPQSVQTLSNILSHPLIDASAPD